MDWVKKIPFAIGFMVLGALLYMFSMLAWHQFSPDHSSYRMTIVEDGKQLFSYPMGKLALSVPENNSGGYKTIRLKFSLVYDEDHEPWARIFLQKNRSAVKDQILYRLQKRLKSEGGVVPENFYLFKDIIMTVTNSLMTSSRVKDVHLTRLTVDEIENSQELSPENSRAKSGQDFRNTDISALHRAIESNDVNEAKRLIKSGADVNVKDRFGQTPLHYASIEGNLRAVKVLINNGAKVNAKAYDTHPITPLQQAVYDGHYEVAEYLIKNGTNVNFNPADQGGASALHLAAVNGNEKMVRLLLKNGANVNALGAEGHKPVELAKMENHEKIIHILKNFQTK